MLSQGRWRTASKVSELLYDAHKLVTQHVASYIKVTKRYRTRERRRDLAVVFLDGDGKSGASFAALYAERNDLLTASVMSGRRFKDAISKYETEQNVVMNAVVVVDDIAGTGETLVANLKEFVAEHADWLKERSAPVVVVVMAGTPDAQLKLEQFTTSAMENYEVKVHFRICDPLAVTAYAFDDESDLWESSAERDTAKSLAYRLGTHLYPKAPLGFGDRGLLVVFPDNCPNNSLPILHATRSGPDLTWKALFPRSVR